MKALPAKVPDLLRVRQAIALVDNCKPHRLRSHECRQALHEIEDLVAVVGMCIPHRNRRAQRRITKIMEAIELAAGGPGSQLLQPIRGGR